MPKPFLECEEIQRNLFASREEERTLRVGFRITESLSRLLQGIGCNFLGFGLHSFRRANITMRQEEGGSSIEASKIAGHATVSQTGDYTVVQLKRQEELTRAIQDRVAKARQKSADKTDGASIEAA